jgi:hypothetical protein
VNNELEVGVSFSRTGKSPLPTDPNELFLKPVVEMNGQPLQQE